MKKLLSLLSVLTISGTTVPTTIAASDYQKQYNIKYSQTNNLNFNNMYVLGNSLSDIGALNEIMSCGIHPLACYNYEGLFKLDDPYYKNRSFSNGPLAVEYLAKKLNLNLTPAWEGEFYKRIGNNYAVAGSLVNSDNFYKSKLTNIPMSLFHNKFSLKQQYLDLINHHILNENDLVVIETGNNDLNEIIKLNDIEKEYKMINYTVNLQKEVICELLVNNVNILVMNIPDLSKTPRYLNTEKEKHIKRLTEYYNNSLKKIIDQFINKKLYYFNLFEKFNKYIVEAKTLGFNTTKATIESKMLSDCFLIDVEDWLMWKNSIKTKYINNFNKNDLKNNIFLDDIHPITWLHEKISNDMYNFLLEKEIEKNNYIQNKINKLEQNIPNNFNENYTIYHEKDYFKVNYVFLAPNKIKLKISLETSYAINKIFFKSNKKQFINYLINLFKKINNIDNTAIIFGGIKENDYYILANFICDNYSYFHDNFLRLLQNEKYNTIEIKTNRLGKLSDSSISLIKN